MHHWPSNASVQKLPSEQQQKSLNRKQLTLMAIIFHNITVFAAFQPFSALETY